MLNSFALSWTSYCFYITCFLIGIDGSALRDTRIIGGNNATMGQFKYSASLQIFNGLHYCGGAIITPRAILTAGHCQRKYAVSVMVGSIFYEDPAADRYAVKEFIVHEDFDPLTLNYDIAIAVLFEDIVFSQYVQPIPLATRSPEVDTQMTLSGWGFVSYPPPPYEPAKRLQWMTTNIVPADVCDDYFEDVETHICTFKTEGQGVCSGDSGGALVHAENEELVGIVSAGYSCAIGYPDSFTNVYLLREWIFDHSLQ